MLGRYRANSNLGEIIFDIWTSNGKYEMDIEIVRAPLPVLRSGSVEERGNTLCVTTSFFQAPEDIATLIMRFDGECYDLSGNLSLVGDISGCASPYTGKTRIELMAEELPKKRTNKYVRRSRTEIDKAVKQLMKRMTLEEKIGQMSQSVGNFTAGIGGFVKTELTEEERIRRGMIGSLNGINPLHALYEKQKIAIEESRLGVPLLVCQDVIHGKSTIFPIPLAWACSFNPSLVEQACRIAAKESTSQGIMFTCAPMVDIVRDPRWGRVAESAGEDPYLGCLMSVAQVKGYQGDDLGAKDSMMACLKHYIGYGAAEAGRDYNTVEISDVTLRNVYLPPFKAGLDAGAASVMNSFNVMNGVPMAINRPLLNDLLRGELGFEGIVISDYGSIDECVAHGAAEDDADAARRALEASMDIEMATSTYLDNLPALVQECKVDEALVDAAVRRILRYKYETGLMDDPYRFMRPEEINDIFCAAHREVSRKLARESIVLLKNDGVLPLRSDKKIAIVGPKGDTIDLLGTWQTSDRAMYTVTLRQGLEAAGYDVTVALGCEISHPIENGLENATKVACDADVVILALGEDAAMSGEASSRQSITVPDVQMDLTKAMQKLGKPMVLVLTNGRPLLLNWFEENCAAIVESWFLGSEAGNALADVLSGAFNPCGKLAMTFPRHAGQIPIYYNHLNTGRPYCEGDSNKFLSKYLDGPNTPLYTFGFGLSYTTFALDGLFMDSHKVTKERSISVSICVTNTGDRDGTEIIQLYLRDIAASIARPVKELKGFERVILAAGESKTVNFEIVEPMLRFINPAGEEVSEPGMFDVMVGTSSDDTMLLKDSFVLV